MIWKEHIPAELQQLYEIHDYHHAAAILAGEFPGELEDICEALMEFQFTEAEVRRPGGNESDIPKKFSKILRPRSWKESELIARTVFEENGVEREVGQATHKVDYIKGRVAFDLEWNSKDQTFDRDLYAFRAFFDCDRISVGVLVTRSNELDPWFKSLGREIQSKFGASTTHMGKLLPRLKAGRNGGCPVLVFGITPRLLEVPPK